MISGSQFLPRICIPRCSWYMYNILPSLERICDTRVSLRYSASVLSRVGGGQRWVIPFESFAPSNIHFQFNKDLLGCECVLWHDLLCSFVAIGAFQYIIMSLLRCQRHSLFVHFVCLFLAFVCSLCLFLYCICLLIALVCLLRLFVCFLSVLCGLRITNY